MEPRDLLATLIGLGYEPEVEVEGVGQVAHRGGIVDFFPPALERPARVEFFGDEIESVRTFDPVTQRSLNPQEATLISPARDALATNGPQAAEQLAKLSLIGLNPDARARWQGDLEALRSAPILRRHRLLHALSARASLPADYLPDDGLLVLHDDASVRQTAEQLAEQGEEVARAAGARGRESAGPAPVVHPLADAQARACGRRQVRFAGLLSDEGIDATPEGSALAPDMLPTTSYGGRLRAFAQDVRKLLLERQRVVVVSAQARRVAELFGDEALLGPNGVLLVSPATDLPDPPGAGSLAVVHGTFAEGWHSRLMALTVFTDAEVFGWSKRRGEPRRTQTPSAFLAEVRPGDFVVHEDHGIGRFDGLTKLATEGVEREYLLIQYAGTDRLYIPTDQLDRITRYLGMGDATPALCKLGGVEWVRAKQRASESAQDIARDLLRLYSVRETVPRPSIPAGRASSRGCVELEEGFPYEETPDQSRAIAEVKEDMERARPMDRLVCGDVGYGKTEVALRAAFKAVLDQRAGRRARADDGARLAALQHLQRAAQALSRARRAAEPLPLGEGAEGGAARPRRWQGGYRHRHASPAAEGCRLQQSGPAGDRRGAALRRGAQGAAQAVAHRGGRADADARRRSRARSTWRWPTCAT